ncbi:efflux RND transporter permease subunit [Desulfovibrio sp. OttesenSCG-928-G11]|nr:efflux RND transporter permease subunit [Desulfovibrio sp. OttesenSCG-928-G11]
MARFFIDRPIFAWVIAIIIMLAGVLSLYTLPVAQYPTIASPEICITAYYPGASAKTVESTVTSVIEQQMKGIDNMTYMYSSSDADGNCTINIAFEAGTDSDIAQVQVQNKLAIAEPSLPQEVTRQGISVKKAAKNYLIIVAFVSEDGSMSMDDINDYVFSNVQDPISRVQGVGDVSLFGSQYAMRIWADPDKFEQYKLNPSDVSRAIQAQNAQVAGGKLGGMPAVPGQQISVTVNAASRLESVEQFRNIMLRMNPDGSVVRLKDVARVELGGENLNVLTRYNGKEASGLALKLATGANALQTTENIKAEVAKLAAFFPEGLTYAFPYDTSPFVRISIDEVYKTLGEAIMLVFLVMFLFLQNFRSTLIPTIAVPVVLLGTFAVLAAFGYSVNTLTMFGLVLAIGLLVDDAIVVVENVERLMHDEHLSPIEASRKSMDQITGALVGIAMVLSAVFVPMAFFGGSTGVIYRQFSITIVSAMVLSVVVALVLTPALCATMLEEHQTHAKKSGGPLLDYTRRFCSAFNRWFDKVTASYQSAVRRMVEKPLRWLLVYAGAVGLMVLLFLTLPTAFLPDEDQGVLFVSIELPPASSQERTISVLKKVEDYFLNEEKDTVDGVLGVAGYNFNISGQNAGMGFIRLKDWSERQDAERKVPAIMARAARHFAGIKEANVFAYAPPAVMELGNAAGFDFELLDRANAGHEALMAARAELFMKARAHSALRNVRPNGLDDVEQYSLDIDLAKAGAQSVDIDELYSTISAYWGSMYINDFLDKGRTKKVYLQADAPFRMQANDFYRFHVRNSLGAMVPFSAIMTGHSTYGAPRLERFNGVPSIEFLGEPAPGMSSGQAMAVMEQLAGELEGGFDFAWTGLSYQERMSGSQAPALYAISLLVVFLCLAALYESWSIPFSVMLVVPFGVIGALGGAFLRGMQNDVYFQVGLLTTVGLSAKNAILIVEYAKDLEEKGMEIIEATVEAAKLRLRPIVMTSLAFILGVLPLATSAGAGSGSQNSLGTAVMVGMIAATGAGIFFTPVFFVVIRKIFKDKALEEMSESDDNAPLPA